jgi:syntaxin-binding protein 1
VVDSDYDLSRFRPLLKTALEDMFNGKLDASVFPYVKDPLRGGQASPVTATAPTPAVTSLRNKPVWTKGGQKLVGGATRSDSRQRVFVFVAGGMTYSEMRSVYELSASAGKDIYIGQCHLSYIFGSEG